MGVLAWLYFAVLRTWFLHQPSAHSMLSFKAKVSDPYVVVKLGRQDKCVATCE